MHEYTSRSRDKKQSVPSPPSIDFRSWIRARQTEVRISLDLFCLELPASFLLFFPVCRPCCSSTVACRHPLWKESKESWNSLACKSRFPSQSADLAEPNISLDYRQPRLYSLKGAPSSPANLRVSRICDWLFVGSGSCRARTPQGLWDGTGGTGTSKFPSSWIYVIFVRDRVAAEFNRKKGVAFDSRENSLWNFIYFEMLSLKIVGWFRRCLE